MSSALRRQAVIRERLTVAGQDLELSWDGRRLQVAEFDLVAEELGAELAAGPPSGPVYFLLGLQEQLQASEQPAVELANLRQYLLRHPVLTGPDWIQELNALDASGQSKGIREHHAILIGAPLAAAGLLARSGPEGPELAARLAELPAWPVFLWRRLMERKQWDSIYFATGKGAPEVLWAELAECPDDLVRSALAAVCPEPAIMEQLAGNDSPAVLQGLAANPAVSRETLERLYNHPVEKVAKAAWVRLRSKEIGQRPLTMAKSWRATWQARQREASGAGVPAG